MTSKNAQELIKEIQELQTSLSKRKGHVITQLVLFVATTMLVLFFVSILVYDLVSTFKIYFTRLYSSNKKVEDPQNDNNEFEDTQYDDNEYEMDRIEHSIMAQSASQTNQMKDMINWKRDITKQLSKDNTMKPPVIENQVTLGVIEGTQDNYDYDNKKNGSSFWKMLIMPPQYNDYITNKATPFHKFEMDL